MLEKDRFLEKTNFLIFLIFIFFSKTLISDTIISEIQNYNTSLINSSAQFIQNDGIEIQEGKIYFGSDRIKINYKYPQNLTLILSKRKGVYINHNLKESQYFNTNKSFIKFFFKLLDGSEFAEIPKIEKGFIKINEKFTLDDIYYQITILYENKPIKIRKLIVLEENQSLEISFFDHKSIDFIDKKFFSMVDPYLN